MNGGMVPGLSLNKKGEISAITLLNLGKLGCDIRINQTETISRHQEQGWECSKVFNAKSDNECN